MFPRTNDNNITTDTILNTIRELYRKKQKPYQSYQRNSYKDILLIGRRNIGKTTLKHILEDPCSITDESSLISRTPSISFHQTFQLSNSNLFLQIVETSIPFERNNDEHLWNINQFCIENRIERFNLICFCRSLNSSFNNGDIEIVNKLVKHFGEQICSQLCLIITHCESKDNEECNRLRNELINDHYFKEIIPYFRQGIHFTGSINRDDFNRKYIDVVSGQFETVYVYRQNLIQLIQNTRDSFRIQPKIEQQQQQQQQQTNHDHRQQKKGCCEIL